ncbi:MAG: hypothetical protein AAB263_12355 [Planctomycetota bacterium]
MHVGLKSAYGFIIAWGEGVPPTFYVFSRAEGLRIKTTLWNTFIHELQRLPDGVDIDDIAKCTVPFAWEMPDGKWQELEQILTAKSMRLIAADDERHTTFCYCESKGFSVLYDQER